MQKEYYHRNLPHWQPAGGVIFITFRLAQSLPQSVLQELDNLRRLEHANLSNQLTGASLEDALNRMRKRYFGYFDSWLDRCLSESPRWLEIDRVARLVKEQIHALDQRRFLLIAYCIMPNHVHLLVRNEIENPDELISHHGKTADYPLADTMKLLKGRTARLCNLALGRSGAFWHHESYDHVARNQEEVQRISGYILNNPVKAGLVQCQEDWPYSYCI